MVKVTSTPASCTSATMASMSAIDWSGGSVCRASSSRSSPSIDRVWVSALRLVSPMTSSACSAAATSVRMTCAPTPAWTAIKRHAVRDDVVQLPGDPEPLLDHGPGGLLARGGRLLLGHPETL